MTGVWEFVDTITRAKEFCNTITRAKIFGDFGVPKRVKCVRTKPERTPKNKTVNIIEQNKKEIFMDSCNENVIEFMTNDTRAASIRAGIVYGWLPIGVAIQNNKPAKSLSGSRITYIVSPRKVYEVTGHVWRGKEALRKKNKAEEHIEE